MQILKILFLGANIENVIAREKLSHRMVLAYGFVFRQVFFGFLLSRHLTPVAGDGGVCSNCDYPLQSEWHYCAECGQIRPRA